MTSVAAAAARDLLPTHKYSSGGHLAVSAIRILSKAGRKNLASFSKADMIHFSDVDDDDERGI
jgi:hypothetical protein